MLNSLSEYSDAYQSKTKNNRNSYNKVTLLRTVGLATSSQAAELKALASKVRTSPRQQRRNRAVLGSEMRRITSLLSISNSGLRGSTVVH